MDIREIKKILKYRYWLENNNTFFHPFIGISRDWRDSQENDFYNPSYDLARNIESMLEHVLGLCLPYVARMDNLFPNSFLTMNQQPEQIESYGNTYFGMSYNSFDTYDQQLFDILKKNVILSLLFDLEQENWEKENEKSLIDYLIRYRTLECEQTGNAEREDEERGYSSVEFRAALEYRKKKVEKSDKRNDRPSKGKISEDYEDFAQLSENEFVNLDKDGKREFLKVYKDHWYYQIKKFNENFIFLSKADGTKKYFTNTTARKNKTVPAFDCEIVGEIIARKEFMKSVINFHDNKDEKGAVQEIYKQKKQIREAVLKKIPSKSFNIERENDRILCKRKIMLELQIERYLAIDLESAILSSYDTLKAHNIMTRGAFEAMTELNYGFIGFDWMINQPLQIFFENIDANVRDDFEKEIVTEKWVQEYIQYLRQLGMVTMPILKAVFAAELHTYWEQWLYNRDICYASEKKMDEKICEKMTETLWNVILSEPEYFIQKADKNEKNPSLSKSQMIEKRRENIERMKLNDMLPSNRMPIQIEVDMYSHTKISEINDDCLRAIYKKMFNQGWMEERHLYDDVLKRLDKPFMEWGMDRSAVYSVAEQNIRLLLGR